MRPRRPGAHPTLLLFVALAAWGCGASADEGGESADLCVIDDDCGPGAVCREGTCVAAQSEPLTVYLELLPEQYPGGETGPSVWLPGFRVEGPAERDFSLSMPATLDVEVVEGETALQGEGRVSLVPQVDGLPSRPRAHQIVDGTLSLTLPTGSRQEITVVPTDPALPPLRDSVVIGERETLRFDYAAVALSTRTVVLEGAGVIEGAAVYALDDRGRRVSSTGTVSAGTAALRFAPGRYPITLRVEPPMAAPNGDEPCPLATVTGPDYTIALPWEDGADEAGAPPLPLAERPPRFAADAEPVHALLQAAPAPIRYRGTVQLCEALNDRLSAVSVPLNLRSAELALEAPAAEEERNLALAEYRTATTATFVSSAGTLQFCAALVPGTYEVVATPPGSVKCSIFAEQRLIKAPPGSDEKTGDALTLGAIATLAGELQTPDGGPVPSATLEANPLGLSEGVGDDAEDAVTRYNRAQQATSDADGAFELPLDIGGYDLVVKPQVGSGLGWLWARDVRIGNSVQRIPANFTHSLPVTVQGAVSYADGDADAQLSLAGARVRAYTVLQSEEGVPVRALQIAEAQLDADGAFRLLVSPTIRNGLLGE